MHGGGNDRSGTDPYRFNRAAQRFMDWLVENGRYPLYYGTTFYVYDGSRYLEVESLPQMIRTFLKKTGLPQSNHLVGNVVPIVENYAYRAAHEYGPMPFYVGNDVTFPSHRNIIAYCLTSDISQHKALVKLGPPRAGKGTTDAVLRAVVGDEHTTGFNLHYLADKFGPRRLEGKLVAFVGEVNLANSREKYRILETWNSIVGGDPVPIEKKNKDESPSLVLPTRFSISCNEMPSFVDPTGALTARLLILNFDRSYFGKEDRVLVEKLLSEIVGISNWALEGYARLRTKGRFTEPEKMKGLLTGFRRENSHLFAFMQDSLLVNKSLDPGNLDGVGIVNDDLAVNSADLEQVYRSWCLSQHKQARFVYCIPRTENGQVH